MISLAIATATIHYMFNGNRLMPLSGICVGKESIGHCSAGGSCALCSRIGTSLLKKTDVSFNKEARY
jgi:hypothetical protein